MVIAATMIQPAAGWKMRTAVDSATTPARAADVSGLALIAFLVAAVMIAGTLGLLRTRCAVGERM